MDFLDYISLIIQAYPLDEYYLLILLIAYK